MMYNAFLLTAAEQEEAMALSQLVVPSAITNSHPGVAINLNPDATDYVPGAVVPASGTLSGMYFLNRGVIDASEQPQALKTYLLGKPWATLDTETILAPVQDV